MLSIQTLIESPVSTNKFHTNRPVSSSQINELVRSATLAPSAYNFQNRKFIAVISPAAKEKLKAAPYGQQKVMDEAVTFIVCGTLNAHQHLRGNFRPSLDQGILSRAVIDTWVGMAKDSHEGNAQLLRDEAFRYVPPHCRQ